MFPIEKYKEILSKWSKPELHLEGVRLSNEHSKVLEDRHNIFANAPNTQSNQLKLLELKISAIDEEIEKRYEGQ